MHNAKRVNLSPRTQVYGWEFNRHGIAMIGDGHHARTTSVNTKLNYTVFLGITVRAKVSEK